MSQALKDGTLIRLAFIDSFGKPAARKAFRTHRGQWTYGLGLLVADDKCLGFHLIDPLPEPPSERVEEEPEPRHTVARIREMQSKNHMRDLPELVYENSNGQFYFCTHCGAMFGHVDPRAALGRACGLNGCSGTFQSPEPEPECGTCGGTGNAPRNLLFSPFGDVPGYRGVCPTCWPVRER